jgi:hypothetical protein
MSFPRKREPLFPPKDLMVSLSNHEVERVEAWVYWDGILMK